MTESFSEEDSSSGGLVASIHVRKLFGLYSYDLPIKGAFTNASIVYGENGVGKTTILRLAFHLLSCADNRGHRSALWGVDFERLEVRLTSGVRLIAERSRDAELRPLELTIWRGDEALARWPFVPRRHRKDDDESRGLGLVAFTLPDGSEAFVLKPESKPSQSPPASTVPSGEKAYLAALKSTVPATFLLNAERRLEGDSIADADDELELRRAMHLDDTKQLVSIVRRSREIALSQALTAASRWIQRRAVLGANQGSLNVHTVYQNIIQHVTTSSHTAARTDTAKIDISSLLERLETVEQTSRAFAKYELGAEVTTRPFQEALRASAEHVRDLTASLIQPYVESLEGRLDALEPIYVLVDKFVSTLNAFLTDKQIGYRLSHGFEISNRLGSRLDPGQLSSGEQQLLLLFCYVLKAHDQPSVFMIDEPEISLNIRWQRRLVQALLDITRETDIQFILASHSMELLAQHRNRVIPLENAL